MKKSAIAICGAALAAVAFAQEPAPAPAPAPEMPAAPAEGRAFQRPDRPQRAQRYRPVKRPPTLVIDEKTTPEQVEAYKKLVVEKIDAAFASYKDKPVAEGEEGKVPTRVMLMVMDRPFGGPGMGPGMGNGPKGPRGDRPQGMRRNRGQKPEIRGPEGPAPAPEGAPAPDPEAK